MKIRKSGYSYMSTGSILLVSSPLFRTPLHQWMVINIFTGTYRLYYIFYRNTKNDHKTIVLFWQESTESIGGCPVSYTHLDVYKRQNLLSFVTETLVNAIQKSVSDVGGSH